MISEIYIEKKRIDVSAEISSLLTFSLDDIKDFSSRNTSFSKTIVIPGTANNNYLFGNIFNVTVSNSFNASGENIGVNFNPAISANCLMFQDHLQVFKGTMRVLEIVITNGIPEYEVAVFGELGGLINKIGNLKLEDLNFSAYDHTFNETNIVNSWSAAQGTGYYYPLIDYGTVSSNKKDYDVRAFRTAFYVREYLDKIITNAGYKWSCALFDTARFKSLIVPHNGKKFQRNTYTLISASRTTGSHIVDSGTGTVVSIDFNSYPLYFFTGGPNTFTFSGASNVNSSVVVSFSGNYIANSTGYKLKLYKNGVEQTAFTKTLPMTGDNNTRLYTWSSINDLIFAPGDTIVLKAEADFAPTGIDYINGIGGLTILSYTPVQVDISYGSLLTVNELIPRNVLQIDFLASIIKLFNLYVYEDSITENKIYIAPYVDYFDINVSGTVDWNYKMDRGKPMRIKTLSELNYRFYNFKFKKGNDFYNEIYFNKYNSSYGDYEYDSQFQFVNEKKDIELIFSPSVLVGYSGEDKVVSALFKKNAGVEETIDTNIRIMQTKRITGVTNWDLKNGASVLTTLSEYGYGGHYDDPDAPSNDIHFGVPWELFFPLATGSISTTQFNVYWSPYMAEITDKDSKLLTAYFKLTASDIFNINFSKLVYCEGCYWRINKIEDWNASEPDVCKVELLKVINTVY